MPHDWGTPRKACARDPLRVVEALCRRSESGCEATLEEVVEEVSTTPIFATTGGHPSVTSVRIQHTSVSFYVFFAKFHMRFFIVQHDQKRSCPI